MEARRRSGVFIFNFEHCFTPFPSLSIAVFQQVNVIWEENWDAKNDFISILPFMTTYLDTRDK